MKPSAMLFDLDGTIYQEGALISGAVEVLDLLKAIQIPFRFITNNTRMRKNKIVAMLGNMGLIISSDDIFAAPHAAVLYCQNKGYKNILLAVQDKEIEEDFSAFKLVKHNPEAVVLGDMGKEFTFELINTLFNHILSGAELVSMHKNRFWKSDDGYTIDVGAFVSALEFASGQSASIMGKPNANLFLLASLQWDIPSSKIVVVGDDIESDVCGASNAGMGSVLVKTGKFRNENLYDSNIVPNYIINSIADLPDTLKLS